MDIQRLRNLTTGRLHTSMECVYEDLGNITGEKGLMTHMLPRAMAAIEPWLKEHVKDKRFWEDKYDTTHVGDFSLPQPTKKDMEIFFERFKEMPNPLASKDAITVVV